MQKGGSMLDLFAPLITPFKSDQSVDFEALQRNVELYERSSLDGFLVNGSSGEAEMLTPEERLDSLKAVMDCARKPVLAGVVAHSTRDALHQLEALATLPLKGVLVRTPSYYGAQHDQVEFYRELGKESAHPILVYQIPQYTGVRLTGDQLEAISHCPGVVGIKDSLGDLSLLNEKVWPQGFAYYLGASSLLQPGVAAGIRGGILALANVVPEACRRLLDLSAKRGSEKQARDLQRRLIPLNRLLGGSRGFGIAGLKAACELRGYESGSPRKPLKSLSESDRKALARAIEAI